MSWTQEEEELAMRLWKESGASASQIADHLPGKSRNAVIGKLSRLGLLGTGAGVRQTPARPKVKGGPKPQSEPSRRVRPARVVHKAARDWGDEPENPPAPLGEVTLGNVSHGQCRWPVGDPRQGQDMAMCGARVDEGRVYCTAHHARAHKNDRGEAGATPWAGTKVWGDAA